MDADLLSRFNLLLQMVQVSQFSAGGGEQVKVLVADSGDCCFPQDAAVLREKVCQGDTAVPGGYPVSQDAVQIGLGIPAADVVFGKAGKVDHPHPFPHGPALLPHRVKGVVVSIAVLLFLAVGGEPLGALPAKGLGELGTLGLQGRVQGAQAAVPACGIFLTGQWRGVG